MAEHECNPSRILRAKFMTLNISQLSLLSEQFNTIRFNTLSIGNYYDDYCKYLLFHSLWILLFAAAVRRRQSSVREKLIWFYCNFWCKELFKFNSFSPPEWINCSAVSEVLEKKIELKVQHCIRTPNIILCVAEANISILFIYSHIHSQAGERVREKTSSSQKKKRKEKLRKLIKRSRRRIRENRARASERAGRDWERNVKTFAHSTVRLLPTSPKSKQQGKVEYQSQFFPLSHSTHALLQGSTRSAKHQTQHPAKHWPSPLFIVVVLTACCNVRQRMF